jgi:shikimate dehydrogenase
MQRYAVVGNPVEHSLSPRIHTLFGAQLGITLSYEKRVAPRDGFVAAIERFFAEGGAGCNVTLPFKEAAFAWVDEHDERAGAAGAVNTIIRVGRSFRGSNTDGIGLIRDLRRIGIELRGARVLVLGAGGAVRGVVGPLLGEAPRELVIANRTRERADELVERFEDPRLSAIEPQEAAPSFDLIVNGSSGGLSGTLPTIDPATARGAFCYDMLYGPAAVGFLEWVSRAGARQCVDGLGMLVEQAAEAFRLWHGTLPETAPVLAELRREIAGRTS